MGRTVSRERKKRSIFGLSLKFDYKFTRYNYDMRYKEMIDIVYFFVFTL